MTAMALIAVDPRNNNENNYDKILLEVSNNLKSKDLKKLKFRYRKIISAMRIDAITKGFELFSALEELNILSEKKVSILASDLGVIGRKDLRKKLLEIQGKNANVLRFM